MQAINAKDDIKKALMFVSYAAYVSVPLMGDLKPDWDIRCHSNFKSFNAYRLIPGLSCQLLDRRA